MLEVLYVADVWMWVDALGVRAGGDELKLPALRHLVVAQGALASVHVLLEQLGDPPITTMSIGNMLGGPAPAWPRSCRVATTMLRLDFKVNNPTTELVDLQQLLRLRTLRLEGLFGTEIEPLLSSIVGPMPSVSELYLGLNDAPLRLSDGAAAAIERGCALAVSTFPSLQLLGLHCQHWSLQFSAHEMPSAMSAQIGRPASWPSLQRVDVGLVSADNDVLLEGIRAVCNPRSVKVVPLIECVSGTNGPRADRLSAM